MNAVPGTDVFMETRVALNVSDAHKSSFRHPIVDFYLYNSSEPRQKVAILRILLDNLVLPTTRPPVRSERQVPLPPPPMPQVCFSHHIIEDANLRLDVDEVHHAPLREALTEFAAIKTSAQCSQVSWGSKSDSSSLGDMLCFFSA